MKTLKIYFTSDMHGFVYPTDYTNNDDKHLGMLNVIKSYLPWFKTFPIG